MRSEILTSGAAHLARPASVALLTVVISCSAGTDRTYVWQGTTETTQCIDVVRNPSLPLIPTQDITVQAGWVAPASAMAGEEYWEDPSRVSVATNSLLVLDRPAHRVHVVSTAGEWTSSFGRAGEGPGEFKLPLAVAQMSDSIVVVDGGKGTIEVFDQAGVHGSSVRMGRMTFGAVRFGADRWLISGMLGSEGGLRIYDMQGSSSPIEFVAADDFAVEDSYCSYMLYQQTVYTLSCVVPTIHRYDEQGTMLGAIVIAGEPEAPTEAELEQQLDKVRRTLAESGQPAALASQMVERMRVAYGVKRKYGSLRIDHTSGILAFMEQNPNEFGSGPATVHLATSSGVFLGSVSFSESWVDFDFLDGRLYALRRDPTTDLVSLATYDIELPQAALAVAVRVVNGTR